MRLARCAPSRIRLIAIAVCLALLLALLPALASADETAVLRVTLNQEPVGDFFAILTEEGDALLSRQALEKTRLRKGLGREVTVDGAPYVSLRSIEGVSFEINEKAVSLEIEAAPGLFTGQELDVSYEKPYKVLYPSNNSAFLNYNILGDTEDSTLDVSTEIGLRAGRVFASSTFDYLRTDEQDRGVRLLSTLRIDDRAAMRTFSMGDFTASSGVLGSEVILGGVGLATNYSVSPYFIKYPPLSLSGALETPSEVSVYVNDRLVSRERLLPGEFTLENIPAEIGRGVSRIVIRDAFGRERVISEPFFYSDRLLKAGLHEYSYSVGFLREDLGEKSFSYGDPVFIAQHVYGFTDALKAGLAVEASGDLFNIGPRASVLLMDAGVLEAAFRLSVSEGDTGFGGLLGYIFKSRFFDTNLSASYLSKHYRTVSSLLASTEIPSVSSGSVGISNKQLGSIALSVIHSDFRTQPDTTRYTASYSRNVLDAGSLFVTASRQVSGGTDEDSIFVGLHYYFGRDFSGSLSYESGGSDNIVKASVQKRLPTGTGWGMRAEAAAELDGRVDIDTEVKYQNRYAIYTAGYRNSADRESLTAQVAGGIGYIDGSVFISRPITDGFAKVKVGGVDDVRVQLFGNEMGRTNDRGEMIIPNLQSYLDNKVSIEPRDIPIDYSITETSKFVSPPFRSGSVVEFDVERTQGFVGRLYFTKEGAKTPVEYAALKVSAKGRTLEGLVGRGGEFYIENIPPGSHRAWAEFGPYECGFDIIIPESEELMVDLGETECRIGQ